MRLPTIIISIALYATTACSLIIPTHTSVAIDTQTPNSTVIMPRQDGAGTALMQFFRNPNYNPNKGWSYEGDIHRLNQCMQKQLGGHVRSFKFIHPGDWKCCVYETPNCDEKKPKWYVQVEGVSPGNEKGVRKLTHYGWDKRIQSYMCWDLHNIHI